jgi:hypothetical protein
MIRRPLRGRTSVQKVVTPAELAARTPSPPEWKFWLRSGVLVKTKVDLWGGWKIRWFPYVKLSTWGNESFVPKGTIALCLGTVKSSDVRNPVHHWIFFISGDIRIILPEDDVIEQCETPRMV